MIIKRIKEAVKCEGQSTIEKPFNARLRPKKNRLIDREASGRRGGDGREALRVWGEDEAFEVRACDKKERDCVEEAVKQHALFEGDEESQDVNRDNSPNHDRITWNRSSPR